MIKEQTFMYGPIDDKATVTIFTDNYVEVKHSNIDMGTGGRGHDNYYAAEARYMEQIGRLCWSGYKKGGEN